MPILDLQRRLAEKGRIRLGEKRTTKSGKSAPAKLDRLRFTSPDRVVIDALAARYGGTTNPWEGQWETISATREIPVVLIPAAMGFSQWYEDWTGAVCQRRCDGVQDHVRDCPCDCDPDARKCKTTTRLSVILPDLPGLGVWRLETHGYNASVEIAAAVEMVELAASAGSMIPARLRLEDRTVKRLIDGKVETRNFVVPVIDLDISARDLMGVGAGQIDGPGHRTPAVTGADGVMPCQGLGEAPPAALPPGETPAGAPPAPSWQPVAAQPPAPFMSFESQLGQVGQKTAKPRKNAATPIPSTGAKPRSVSERVCHLCGESYGDGALIRNPSPDGSRFVHKACAADMEVPQVEGAGDSQDTGVGDPDSTSSPPLRAEPVRATTPSLSDNQRRMLMALIAEAWPVDPQKMTGAEVDDYRRENTIALAGQLGIHIASRTDLDKKTGSLVIDALKGIKDGTLGWLDGKLIDGGTGAVVEP